MSAEQTLTINQIDKRIADLRARELKGFTDSPDRATVGDWLLIKQSLAEGEAFERKLFVVGEDEPQEPTV